MRHVLHTFGYPDKDLAVAHAPDPLVVGGAADLFGFDSDDVDW